MSHTLKIIRTLDTYDGTTLSAIAQLRSILPPTEVELTFKDCYLHFCGYDFENNGPIYFCKPLGENDQFYLTEGLIAVRDFLLSPESPLTIIRTHSMLSSEQYLITSTIPTIEDLEGLPEEGVYLT